jgi:hypothetical protein
MRTVGRRSVASAINVVLAFVRLGLTFSFLVVLFSTVGLLFFKPSLAVVVPVSFHVENTTPLRGRPDFGFQIMNESVGENEDLRGHVERIDGALRIPATSRRFLALNAAILLVILFVVLLVLDRLRAVLKTLVHGTPFVSENAARIRFVAIAVIAGELGRTAIVLIENHYAATHVAIAGVTFDAWPHLNVSALISGFILLVIAEVFRAGTRLDEEQSLTI